MDMERDMADPALFNSAFTVLISKHVDDGLVVVEGKLMDKLLADLGKYFLLEVSDTMRDGDCHIYLGRDVFNIPGSFRVRCRPVLIDKLLEITGMSSAAAMPTPGCKADAKADGEEEIDPTAASDYRAAVGHLLFISQERFDISYCTKECARGAWRSLRLETVHG